MIYDTEPFEVNSGKIIATINSDDCRINGTIFSGSINGNFVIDGKQEDIIRFHSIVDTEGIEPSTFLADYPKNKAIAFLSQNWAHTELRKAYAFFKSNSVVFQDSDQR